MGEKEKQLVARWFVEIGSEGRLDAVPEVFASDYIDHEPFNVEQTRGAKGVRAEIAAWREMIPDFRYLIDDQIAADGTVLTRWHGIGTLAVEYAGAVPNGESFRFEGMTLHRVEEGRIVEGWWNWDCLGFLRQIGAVEDPSR